MKKRPRLVLWSLLILSVVLPFSVPVEAGPSRVDTRRAAARHGNGAPKGSGVAYSLVPSCKSILIRNPFPGNSLTMTMVNHDHSTCDAVKGLEIAVQFIFSLFNRGILQPIST